MKKILIFNLNWLGDCLFSTPAIRAIRKAYPDSYIAVVIPKNCFEILEGNPNINEIIFYDDKSIHKSVFSKLKFIQDLKVKHFDIAILFHRSFTRALLVYLAGIKERIGYERKKRDFLLTKKIPFVERDSLHRIDYFLNLVDAWTLIKTKDKKYDFFIPQEAREYINEFLKDKVTHSDYLIVLNPGGNWPPKRWPIDYFAKLADRLIDELNVKIIITGSVNDLGIAQTISNLMHNKQIILCGKTNLKQLGALFERADLVISADSGPMHIAASLGKKLIAIFGPTAPKITGPYNSGNCIVLQKDIGCSVPCFKINCYDNRCMKELSVDDVFNQVIKIKNVR
ncbi:MAG: lipopolysaccharide heptosyltransferase II [Candidatus Omnitrophota bacterium]